MNPTARPLPISAFRERPVAPVSSVFANLELRVGQRSLCLAIFSRVWGGSEGLGRNSEDYAVYWNARKRWVKLKGLVPF